MLLWWFLCLRRDQAHMTHFCIPGSFSVLKPVPSPTVQPAAFCFLKTVLDLDGIHNTFGTPFKVGLTISQAAGVFVNRLELSSTSNWDPSLCSWNPVCCSIPSLPKTPIPPIFCHHFVFLPVDQLPEALFPSPSLAFSASIHLKGCRREGERALYSSSPSLTFQREPGRILLSAVPGLWCHRGCAGVGEAQLASCYPWEWIPCFMLLLF